MNNQNDNKSNALFAKDRNITTTLLPILIPATW